MTKLRRYSEYTYKFNAQSGRHGWLRLTPAYSLKIVRDILLVHSHARRVLDPFCGTGTTALAAACHDLECVTIDINPFLVWLAKVKTSYYSPEDIRAASEASKQVLSLVSRNAVEPHPAPPMFNIERWWSRDALAFLQLLRAGINAVASKESSIRSLLDVAFCRTLIALSNAAFNHQSMSFKDNNNSKSWQKPEAYYECVFESNIGLVLGSAEENPRRIPLVIQGDSRKLDEIASGRFDLVITSPPYANRLSYVRELRPYMYWLNFLSNGRDAGELDWLSIGGTWGIATSRLMGWERSAEHFKSKELDRVLDSISQSGNRNGVVMAKYIAKYFDDVWAHLSALPKVLTKGAEVHYIVGNSAFYGTVVPTEMIYVEMLRFLGFTAVECKPIRKRNSKKDLVEFKVSARWM